jgi:hypothetical protein
LYILPNGTQNTELRECFGRKENKDLLLWAEEVRYLQNKGMIASTDVEVNTGLESFYTQEKDDGQFLIRTSAVPDSFEDIESKQELKRPKVDEPPLMITFDYYQNRASFHKKTNICKKVIFSTGEKVDL